MSFYEEYLNKHLKDPEFQRAWEESEEEYLKIRDNILKKITGMKEIKVGQMMVCCSKLCSNFVFGKEYKLTDISYSGNSYELIDENGEWAGIGSSFFTTREKFNRLTEDEIINNDKEIEEARMEFDKFREQQWQEFLEDEKKKNY